MFTKPFFVVKILVITICDDEGVAEPPWQRMEESMLQIKNLTITHIKDNRILLQDLSFVLNQGDKVAIIGDDFHFAEVSNTIFKPFEKNEKKWQKKYLMRLCNE